MMERPATPGLMGPRTTATETATATMGVMTPEGAM
jgi:hypothetical protein